MHDEDLILEESEKVLNDQKKEESKIEQMENISSFTEKEQRKLKPCRYNRITRTEALLISIVLFLAILVGASTVQYNGMANKDEIIDEIADLKLQINDLKSEIIILENKLNDAEFDSQKPIDITIDFTQLEDIMNGEQVVEGEDTTIPDGDQEPFDETAFLGIGFVDVELAANNPLGLKIDHVYEMSPAEAVGMKAGDIIISINGNPIQTYQDLDAVMANMKANEEIEIYLASSSETGIDFITVKPVLTYKGNFDLD